MDMQKEYAANSKIWGPIAMPDVAMVQQMVTAHENFAKALSNFHDGTGNRAVSFPVYSSARLLVGAFHETKHSAVMFVHPELMIDDAILALNRLICDMR